MKHFSKSFLCVSLLFATANMIKGDNDSCSTSNDCGDRCVTLFIPRSAGDDLARQAHHNSYRYGEDCFYGEFNVTYEFKRNFREERIAKSLFGNDCLSFVGNAVTTRNNQTDIIANNFGLAADSNTKIGFAPRIDNHVIDLQLYLGLNELWEGLYAQFNAPIVHSKWGVRAGGCSTANDCDTDCNDSTALPKPSTTTAYPAGCMDVITAGTIASATSFDGKNGALSGDFLFGDMNEKWEYGRFSFCKESDTKLADFYMNLGYNFYECPDYHFGVFARVVAPTGTDLDKNCAVRDVFYPIIGQDHWRLGGGITAHAELYNCNDEHFINMYLEAYAVHLFERCQIRSFDFKDKGCMSRYMLLKEFNADNTYNNKMINAINFATRKAEVSVDVQGELLVEFVYNNDCGFSAGLGYNLYGISKEEICAVGAAAKADIDARRFGFKGCSPIEAQGYQTNDGAGALAQVNTGIAATRILSSTQNTATITQCGTTDNAVPLINVAGTTGFKYYNSCATAPIINDTLANLYTGAEESATGTLALATDGGITGLVRAPVIVTKEALDKSSGEIGSQISHKIFGHLDYEWVDCDWAPYVRVGAQVEFASCKDAGTMNSWGVFFGGGLAF